MSVGCTAKWSDGVVTRMGIHEVAPSDLVQRAIRVSYAAYRSRTKYRGESTIIDSLKLDNGVSHKNIDVTQAARK